MKAEINSENKAMFFAMYWGQYVLREYGKHQINQYFVNHIDCDMPDHFLELKPLSKISDEDAEMIVKIIYGEMSQSDELTRHERIEEVKKIIKSLVIYAEITDYLRSRSYALPWMGISVEEMIEAGWIKLMKG